MQILSFPPIMNIALCILTWGFIQVAVALLVRAMPSRFFADKNILFRSWQFEKHGFYERYFRIKSWKKFLPDGSAITGVGLKKKRLCDMSKNGLEYYIEESCRAELTHTLAIPPFILFGFFCPPSTLPLMLIYALAANLPCLITQRYNRPRVRKILERGKSLTPPL